MLLLPLLPMLMCVARLWHCWVVQKFQCWEKLLLASHSSRRGNPTSGTALVAQVMKGDVCLPHLFVQNQLIYSHTNEMWAKKFELQARRSLCVSMCMSVCVCVCGIGSRRVCVSVSVCMCMFGGLCVEECACMCVCACGRRARCLFPHTSASFLGLVSRQH